MHLHLDALRALRIKCVMHASCVAWAATRLALGRRPSGHAVVHLGPVIYGVGPLHTTTKRRTTLRARVCSAAVALSREVAAPVTVHVTLKFPSRSVAAFVRSARWTALRGASPPIVAGVRGMRAACCSQLQHLATTRSARTSAGRVAHF